MEEKTNSASSATPGDAAAQKPRSNWKVQLLLSLLAVLTLLAIYAISMIFMPVWWATRISSHNLGSATGGWFSGFSLGYVFTLIPLLVLWQVRYKKLSWRWRGVIAVLAIILAFPNWLTLGIFWNPTDAAQKAQAILNTGATWFGGATLAGAISAAVTALIVVIIWIVFRRRGARVKNLEAMQEASRGVTPHDQGQGSER